MSLNYANNITHLQKHYPAAAKILPVIAQASLFQLEITKNEMFTARYQPPDRSPLYVHSRYNPLEEARRWLSAQLQPGCQQVVFYGFGCGYMVQALLEINPAIKIYIYEPGGELFKLIIENYSLNKLINPKNIIDLVLATPVNTPAAFINQIVTKINTSTQLLVLPAYHRIFTRQVAEFQKEFLKIIEQYKINLNINANSEIFWTLNALANSKTVQNTPNIFDQKAEFTGKPLLLVAAGPSLEQEYQNLKQIHQNKMAYIFAVGSAIHALTANAIVPHAFCSYDPYAGNEKLFAKLVKPAYPLIFGSSIFQHTLKYHHGPKIHMLINQDTINPFLLGVDKAQIINDAPSIAICVLQLAYKLGCNPIILVGQDFAYPKNQVYAQDSAVNRAAQLTSAEKEQAFTVTAVDGTLVETSKSFQMMRRNMESYLSTWHFAAGQVINTSPAGAKIAGTVAQSLKAVIAEQLQANSINPQWHVIARSNPDKNSLNKNIALLNDAIDKFKTLLQGCYAHLNNIARYRTVTNRVNTEYQQMVSKINAMDNNIYYKTLIRPMVRAEAEVLNKFTTAINQEKNPVKKTALIIQHYVNLTKNMEKAMALTVTGVKELQNSN